MKKKGYISLPAYETAYTEDENQAMLVEFQALDCKMGHHMDRSPTAE